MPEGLLGANGATTMVGHHGLVPAGMKVVEFAAGLGVVMAPAAIEIIRSDLLGR